MIVSPRGWLPGLAVAVLSLVMLVAVTTPAADAQCTMVTLPAFSAAASSANLGCATSEPFMSAAAEQPFQHGTMLWLHEWGSISVLQHGGAYESHEDQFNAGEIESAGLVPPSAELQEPKQGFGAIWRKLGAASAPVGWATATETSYVATVQYMQRGAIIQRADGTVYTLTIFNHTRGQWATSGQ
jgi:hypothetical protein